MCQSPEPPLCRAFTGAWIETIHGPLSYPCDSVAPSRARGLKLALKSAVEMPTDVAPSRARGLKRHDFLLALRYIRRAFTGAWIETRFRWGSKHDAFVAPSRARGLKRLSRTANGGNGGRAFTGAWIETFYSRLARGREPTSRLHGRVD